VSSANRSYTTSRLKLIGIVMGLAVVAAACSSGGATTAAPSTGTPASVAPSAAASASAAAGPLKLGVVNFDTSTVAAQSQVDVAMEAFKAEGWDAAITDAKGDAAAANGICAQYATQKVDAIVAAVFAADQMAQCLDAAKTADIPVFFFASSFQEGTAGALSTTGAQGVNDMFVEDFAGKDGLQVLALGFTPGAPCRERKENFTETLAASGIKATVTDHEVKIPGQVVDAQAATQAWLTAHPAAANEPLAVWACFSDPAVGAVSAMAQTGRTGVPVYTWDLTKQAVDYIRNGQIRVTSLPDGKGMGPQIVGQIKDYMATGTPQALESGSVLLTKENIDQFLTENPDAAQ